VIVSVPEGLPLAVSIAMAFSVDYMKKDNLLVKKMASVETMGKISEICTGKTATLTKNEQVVKKVYIGEKTFEDAHKVLPELNEVLKGIFVDCIIKNCDARVEMSADGFYEPVGNGTETAMLSFLQYNGVIV
jgi:magnesium-transporting ATPase (P-type)